MSEPVTALGAAVAAGEVTIRARGLQGMISLRGDLNAKKLRVVCTSLTGQDMPDPNKANIAGEAGLCWMSPDELLLLVPYSETRAALAAIDTALTGAHYLAENVSDARALICVEGTYSREVMAKLTPVDLHPARFRPGDFRRSRLAQIAAAFWMQDDDTFNVICFRSVARYAFDLLAEASAAGPVGHWGKLQ